jgi:hypothetical protein
MRSSATWFVHVIECANAVCEVGRARVEGAAEKARDRVVAAVREVRMPITSHCPVQRTAEAVGGVVSRVEPIMSYIEVPSGALSRMPAD